MFGSSSVLPPPWFPAGLQPSSFFLSIINGLVIQLDAVCDLGGSCAPSSTPFPGFPFQEEVAPYDATEHCANGHSNHTKKKEQLAHVGWRAIKLGHRAGLS
mmetsp:Transcript_40319/g.100041  ORF Transcript_40319/g.100041 Transcript_40319/m.100041 type:complete len:101 (+) Transcript_40319:187-489(+)